MKILLINQVFHPDIVATSQYLTDLAVYLVQKGHEVTVLAGRRSYNAPYDLYARKERYKGVNIVRVCSIGFGRKNRLARIAEAFLMNVGFAWKLLFFRKFDRVVAMTTPPLVAWLALIYSRCIKSRFIYWMMDVNPDQAINAGWIDGKSFRARILNSALKYVLYHSDKVVVLDPFMEELIEKKGTVPGKIKVIPLWPHEEDLEIVGHQNNPFRKEHGLDNKFVIMYSGNLSVCHPLDTLLEAALQLKNDLSVIFVFIGGGERVNEVLEFKQRNKMLNIIYIPYQRRDQMKYSLSAADIHVAVMGDPYIGIVHPSKIYGILTLGKPFVFIGPDKSNVGEIVKKSNIGTRIAHGNVAALIQTINKIKNLSQEEKTRIANESIALKNERFSQNKLCHDLEQIICA